MASPRSDDLSCNAPFAELTDLDDKRVEALLPSLDGRWSSQTRAIVERLGDGRLDLNANWASTPSDWRCPVCHRRKPDIARRSSAGVVICHLETHHDHLGDEGARRLWKGVPVEDEDDARRARANAISACQDLAMRFHPTLVCKDCNLAEGKAKAELLDLVHPEFSFSPAEIRRFISVAPNQPHEVSLETAASIWNAIAEDVTDRLDFMQVIARRIADGRHRRERSYYHPGLAISAASDVLRSQGAAESLEVWATSVVARSIQTDGFGTSLKSKSKAKVATPTAAEFDAFVATKRPTDYWHAPPADWRCASCDRDRFEILRRAGKSGLWTANIHQRRVFKPETRDDAILWRYGWREDRLTYGDHTLVYVCQDCRLILTDVRRAGTNLIDDCLLVAQLRVLLTEVAPHARPEYDKSIAARAALDNYEQSTAIQDYDAHRRRCLNLFYNRRALLRVATVADVRAQQLLSVWDDHLTDKERPGMLDWLLTEGGYYAAANARDRWPPNAADAEG